MAVAYDDGRVLLPEAETAWAESVDGLVEVDSTLVDVAAGRELVRVLRPGGQVLVRSTFPEPLR